MGFNVSLLLIHLKVVCYFVVQVPSCPKTFMYTKQEFPTFRKVRPWPGQHSESKQPNQGRAWGLPRHWLLLQSTEPCPACTGSPWQPCYSPARPPDRAPQTVTVRCLSTAPQHVSVASALAYTSAAMVALQTRNFFHTRKCTTSRICPMGRPTLSFWQQAGPAGD